MTLYSQYMYSKQTFRVSMCVFLFCLFVSCEKTTIDNKEGSPIAFVGAIPVPVSKSITKTDGESSFQTGDKLGLFAYQTGASQWEEAKSTATPNLMYNQQVTKDTGGWTYSPVRYWVPGSTYSFFAYAPYNGGGVTFSGVNATGAPLLQVTTPTTAAQHIDLKYACCLNADDSWPVVSLPFAHALTRVRFTANVSADANYYRAIVTGIYVSGVNNSGKLSLETGVWSEVGGNATMMVRDSSIVEDDIEIVYSKTTPDVELGTMYLIPQQLTGEIRINYTILSPFEEDPILRRASLQLNNADYASGKALHYQLSIRLTGVAFTAQVEDWVQNNSPSGISLE